MQFNENMKYYWSPSVKWEANDNEVKIEMFVYKDYVTALFPKFFFICQKGASLKEICNAFTEAPLPLLKMFFIDLFKKRVLVNTVLTPQELYFSQNKLHQHSYPESITYDENELKQFKKKQLGRQYYTDYVNSIQLADSENIPDIIIKRKTYRLFKKDETISFKHFSNFLSVLKQNVENDEIRYLYGSAGGLYPIDIYLHIKPNRIQRIDGGVYYYNPVDNSIIPISSGMCITKDCHHFTNQYIFEASAFTVYFVYNCDVTMPKYGGMGYFYAGIDTGIMVSTLTNMAELNNLGVCSIGDMNFKKIEPDFKLTPHQIFIHALEVGIKV